MILFTDSSLILSYFLVFPSHSTAILHTEVCSGRALSVMQSFYLIIYFAIVYLQGNYHFFSSPAYPSQAQRQLNLDMTYVRGLYLAV